MIWLWIQLSVRELEGDWVRSMQSTYVLYMVEPERGAFSGVLDWLRGEGFVVSVQKAGGESVLV
jgi:hypothetical protein